MELKVGGRYSWLKWIGVVIAFLIFTFVTAVPRAIPDDSLIAGITSASGPAGNPVPTVPVNAQESVPDQAPQSETPPAPDFEPNAKPISAPTSPSRISSPPAAKPAAVLIPASASVTSASAAAVPIVDDLFTAVAIAAPETED